MNKAKFSFYTDFIDKNGDSKGKLFRAVKGLLTVKNSLISPNYSDKTLLVDDLDNFFMQHISRIRSELDSTVTIAEADIEPIVNVPIFESFEILSEDDVRKLITTSTKKFCVDPMPTPLLFQFLDVLLPMITRMINRWTPSIFLRFPSIFLRNGKKHFFLC